MADNEIQIPVADIAIDDSGRVVIDYPPAAEHLQAFLSRINNTDEATVAMANNGIGCGCRS